MRQLIISRRPGIFGLGITVTWVGNKYVCFNFNYVPQKIPRRLHLSSMGPCKKGWAMHGLELKIRASQQACGHGSFSVFPFEVEFTVS